MERFENTIVKHREEINGKMTEMFGLLKELTTRRTPEKVLIREEAKFTITKNVNSISLIKGEEEGSNRTKFENGDGNKSIKTSESEEAQEAPGSQPVAYYLKHNINEKLIKGGPAYDLILKKKITMKEDIGGNFEIPCSIGNLKHVNALVDQGENKSRPFILGTPFLTTTKASIKFDTGTITLRSGKHKVSFHWIPDSSKVTNKGVKNNIEPIAPTITINRLVLEWEEKIKLHLEREMQFNQWRSKNFKGMHPTLIATKEGMDDEGEVT
ncbi:hypothetical protein Tco_1511159 [Tanacetum coccineum]